MRALRLTLAPHRAALAMAAGRFRPELYHGGRGSPLRLVSMPRPRRPPGWVRVRPTLAGICASDRKLLHLRLRTISDFGATALAHSRLPWSIVPGHEIVGVVAEADARAGVGEGDRVVADWLLGCRDKGLEPCDRCSEGNEQVCERWLEGGSSGYGFGFDARYGGGWAEELVVPAGRVHAVPAGLTDEVAVLAEPFGVGVHAVANHLPRNRRVLVIGPGGIGLAVITALARLAPDAEVTAAGVHPASEELARRAGASAFLLGTRNDLIAAAATHTGGRLRGNRLSGPVLDGGFDVVFDTVGAPQTLDDALRVVRPRGTIVLVGTAARQEMDWTLVWSRELTVAGSAYSGEDTVPDGAQLPAGRRASMQIGLELLADTRPRHLLTHIYPLTEPVAALQTAAAGPAAGAVKVAFDPQRVERAAAA